MFDYAKLKGRIAEKSQTHKAVAAVVGLSPTAFGAKIRSGRGFKAEQIMSACKMLDIPDEEIGAFFYVKKFD